jgi:transcriptional regulator with XRE-family HTH domain
MKIIRHKIENDSKAKLTVIFKNMTHKIHLLRWYRKESHLLKQDVAHLLGIQESNLTRYEKGNRNPTPEIILTYHILFGASLKELFLPLYEKLVVLIRERSKKLINQLNIGQSPKSNHRLSALNEIVNSLSHEKPYEQEV